MNVLINGQTEAVTESTLEDLCKRYHDQPNFIATAVNGEFVAVLDRAAHKLKEGDKVEILSPRQGG